MKTNKTCRGRITLVVVLFALQILSGPVTKVNAQGLDKFDRDNALAMLQAVKSDLKKFYYDPQLRGMDVETRFKNAEEQLKQANTRDQLILTIAQTSLDLNDSHTSFVPPSRAAKVQYGWEMFMVGDKAFVKEVKPKSDAEAKGLKRGDAIISVDGYSPTRDNMWKMAYRYYALMPARSIHLVVQSPGEDKPRELDVLAKVERTANVTDWQKIFIRYLSEEWDIYHDRFYELGHDVLIWQMPSFAMDESHVDAIMKRAHGFKSMIIDLRGNGGGYVDALERLVGYFFDHDVKVADTKARKEIKPVLAKTRGDGAFKGQLVVLIDSQSSSASELFARVIQLEQRGTVLGDRSSGMVMMSKYYEHQAGVGNVLYFGVSVTIADLIMKDGKSLEKVGVTPDVIKIPSGADLAARRDPVLAHAANLLGANMDPEKAGSLFPKEWH